MKDLSMLRLHLSEVVFARVTNTVAKDEHLISYRNDGISTWREDPGFIETWQSMRPAQKRQADACYNFYYGFASSVGGDIHFDSKGHRYQNDNYAELGVFTQQHTLNAPHPYTWIVGCIDKTRDDHATRPHFHSWSRCTEAEKRFAEHLLAGKTKFNEEELKQLFVIESGGERSSRLAHMALLLLSRDLEYFLRNRWTHGGEWIDTQVYEVLSDYDPELWERYKELALTQRTYSTLIPEPKPQPIIELRNVADGEPVGLNTPFAGLKI